MTKDGSDTLIIVLRHQAEYIESLKREIEYLEAEVFTLKKAPNA